MLKIKWTEILKKYEVFRKANEENLILKTLKINGRHL